MAGLRRFTSARLLRVDVALHALMGISRFPIDDTIHNSFKRFRQGQCRRFFSGLPDWQLERPPECSSGYALDLNSAVFAHCGHTRRVCCTGPTRASMYRPGINRH